MNKRRQICIATRKSLLAMHQAEFVKQALQAKYKNLEIELLGITTKGDIKLDTTLAKIGGKGLFVKELEHALLRNEADIAVHSIKDMPAELPEGLSLAVICKREDPRDTLVSNTYNSLDEFPANAIIGTSSLRRQCQLKTLRPDLQVKPIRGNLQTRLAKLDNQEFDGIILAAAGLIRLHLHERICDYLAPNNFIPAVGQGALGIECRSEDKDLIKLLQPLDDLATRYCITAERSLIHTLDGNCQTPIGGYATISNNKLLLRGLMGMPDGTLIIRAMKEGLATEGAQLGKQLAQQLLKHGADELLGTCTK